MSKNTTIYRVITPAIERRLESLGYIVVEKSKVPPDGAASAGKPSGELTAYQIAKAREAIEIIMSQAEGEAVSKIEESIIRAIYKAIVTGELPKKKRGKKDGESSNEIDAETRKLLVPDDYPEPVQTFTSDEAKWDAPADGYCPDIIIDVTVNLDDLSPETGENSVISLIDARNPEQGVKLYGTIVGLRATDKNAGETAILGVHVNRVEFTDPETGYVTMYASGDADGYELVDADDGETTDDVAVDGEQKPAAVDKPKGKSKKHKRKKSK